MAFTLSGDAATNRTNLGLGTAATLDVGSSANNIVQLDGSGNLPAIDGSALTNLPGGGKVLQVVQNTYSTAVNYGGGGTWANTGLDATITPTASDSKVLILVNQMMYFFVAASYDRVYAHRILRGSTAITTGATRGNNNYSGASSIMIPWMGVTSYLDSPATTSATTYSTQFYQSSTSSDIYAQHNSETSSMILIEIGA